MKRHSFRKRITESERKLNTPMTFIVREKGESLSNKVFSCISSISQALMLLLVSFGYIYTVKPKYSYDILTEENAKLEISLRKHQIEIDKLKSLAEPLIKLNKSLENQRDEISRSVEELKQRKDTLEEQISFMRYSHIYPDGSPAKTQEQVEEVNEIRKQERRYSAKLMYVENFRVQSTLSFLYSPEKKVAFISIYYAAAGSDTYPFTPEESNVNTDEEAIQFIRNTLIQYLESFHDYYTSSKKLEFDPEVWKDEVRKLLSETPVNINFSKPPNILIREYKSKVEKLEAMRHEEMALVEKEFKGWENYRNSYKKEILKHNYHTSKQNVSNRFDGKLYELDREYNLYAEEIRKNFKKAYRQLVEDVYGQLFPN